MKSHEQFLIELSQIQPHITPIEKYKGANIKILIKDSDNIEYLCKPNDLLAGKVPSIRLAVDKNKCFISKAQKVHSSIYDYSKIKYTYNYKKIEIICSKHGSFFQDPGDHLKGNGCRKCAFEKQSYLFKDFVKKAKSKHFDKYEYVESKYVDYHTNTIIVCPNHGEFTQTPASHVVTKVGCPKCIERSSFSRSSWIKFSNKHKNSNPKVYIIRCYNQNEEFVKIGITFRSVSKRFDAQNRLPYSYEVIKEIKGSADFVWDKEKDLHRKYKSLKYKPQISFAGQTECFTTEILNSLPS